VVSTMAAPTHVGFGQVAGAGGRCGKTGDPAEDCGAALEYPNGVAKAVGMSLTGETGRDVPPTTPSTPLAGVARYAAPIGDVTAGRGVAGRTAPTCVETCGSVTIRCTPARTTSPGA